MLGTLIMAIGIVVFVSPLKLAPGGVYGIAIISHFLFGTPIGLVGICLEIPLLILGSFILGARFRTKTIVGIVSLAVFISLLEFLYGIKPLIALPDDPTTPDPAANFIISLFGGVIEGVGLGIIFRARATTGGTDIVAMILAKYFKYIRLGTILIIVDSAVVLLALVAFDSWTIPLYSWLVIYMVGFTVDKMISGFDKKKALFIISEKHAQIRDMIIQDVRRGGTFFRGTGLYLETEKKIIFTHATNKELPDLLHSIHQIDEKAFISIMDATDVLGERFGSLKERAVR
jgi:uncharacterized membrane-anchored protein YitT (DUF2179 family)